MVIAGYHTAFIAEHFQHDARVLSGQIVRCLSVLTNQKTERIVVGLVLSVMKGKQSVTLGKEEGSQPSSKT